MDELSYWKKQTNQKPLFPDIIWNKPERKDQFGKLGIIGGNKFNFLAVSDAYKTALLTGVEDLRILLPASLKRIMPNDISSKIIFSKDNQSGSLNLEARHDLDSIGQWSDGILLIGDTGQNSETSILLENFISKYEKPVVITRDAVNLLTHGEELLQKNNIIFILSLAQLQKIFRNIYYPKVISFSMQLMSLIESLHQFTITYQVAIMVFHEKHIVLAQNGTVITQPYDTPTKLWNGYVATKAASFIIWNNNIFKSVATSLIEN